MRNMWGGIEKRAGSVESQVYGTEGVLFERCRVHSYGCSHGRQ